MVHSEEVRNSFAQRLAQACKKFGLDDHGRGMVLARHLGVSSKAVSKWFNGESLPRQEKINAIAHFLNVDIVWLQHGKNSGADRADETHLALSPRKKILLELFDELPDSEADALLKTLEEKKQMYDTLYAELDEKKKRKKKAS